ncbi:hypothetical protein NMG60_11023520 [Bertholletia excelsa]
MELPRLDQKMEMKKKRKRSDDRAGMKVVYISSPVIVRIPASVFRTIVQELTGRHSDVSRFVETNGHATAAAASDNFDFNFKDHNYTTSHGDLHLEIEGSGLSKSRSSSTSDSGDATLSSSPTSFRSVFEHDAYVASSDLVHDSFFQEIFLNTPSAFGEFDFDY